MWQCGVVCRRRLGFSRLKIGGLVRKANADGRGQRNHPHHQPILWLLQSISSRRAVLVTVSRPCVCMPFRLLFIRIHTVFNTKSRESAHSGNQALWAMGLHSRVSVQRLAWQDKRREIITVLWPTASNSPIVTHHGVVNSILAVVAGAGAWVVV